MPELLEFEEPVGVLLKEIEALSMLPQTPERQQSIDTLRRRADEIRTELYANLTPWQRVLVARHPSRPNTLDYVERLFTGFDELHGDRRFADDHAIVCGLADYHGQPVCVMGHQKGRDTKQKIFRNFGYARPEGYRKALRVMRLADKFGRPIVVFIDTPAAYPGIESEERGVAEAIAYNLREMIMLEVPIVVIVCGEGGSGGALGIAIGDRVLMQEFSVYSVIPPEGCAAILWRDANRKVEAAEALKLTAPDLLSLGLIDEIVPEPAGGAHNDHDRACALVDQALQRALATLLTGSAAERLAARYDKFRNMGREGEAFVDKARSLPVQGAGFRGQGSQAVQGSGVQGSQPAQGAASPGAGGRAPADQESAGPGFAQQPPANPGSPGGQGPPQGGTRGPDPAHDGKTDRRS